MDNTDNFPTRKHLPHTPPVSVSQYAAGAPYFITICADRRHYGIIDAGRVVLNAPMVGRVIPNAPMVGRVIPNAPMVGRVIPNAPPRRHKDMPPYHATRSTVGRVVLNAPSVGRVVPNAPTVGRVVPNAPDNGGIRICRPTTPNNRPTATPLTDANNAIRILFALDHYRVKGALFPRLAVVMPDHIHVIASFSESVVMAQLIRSWKRWTAKATGIVWQDGFFDHRLRNDAELAEKMAYVANNPVRKGLCESADAWPFRMTWQ